MHTAIDLAHFAFKEFEKTDLYYGHGTDNAWDDACALVLDALDLAHDASDEVLNQKLDPQEISRIKSLVSARVEKNIPTPYLTHKAWFCGLEFYIDERALIPRSPLGEFIMNAGSPWVENSDQVTRVLDLCTGSGCIAIACAYAFPNAVIDAVELSPEALEVAKINRKKHCLENRLNLYLGDLFQPVLNQQYDLIISNPPYVGHEEMSELPKEYLHEPDMALRAGELGLDLVDQMLKQANQFLKPHGILIVEVGNTWQIMDQVYPATTFNWLEFQNGGDGVFLLTKSELSIGCCQAPSCG